MLQAYAEGYEILHASQSYKLDLTGSPRVWNHGSVVRSWLNELAERRSRRTPSSPSSRATSRIPAKAAGRSRRRSTRRARAGDHAVAVRALPLAPGRDFGEGDRGAAQRVRRPRGEDANDGPQVAVTPRSFQRPRDVALCARRPVHDGHDGRDRRLYAPQAAAGDLPAGERETPRRRLPPPRRRPRRGRRRHFREADVQGARRSDEIQGGVDQAIWTWLETRLHYCCADFTKADGYASSDARRRDRARAREAGEQPPLLSRGAAERIRADPHAHLGERARAEGHGPEAAPVGTDRDREAVRAQPRDGEGAQQARAVASSARPRSTASITTWGRRRCRTSSCCASPT